MKLNNHGWGTKEFIFSIVAILILLLVVAINVHRLYNALDEPSYNTNTSTNSNTNRNTNTNNNNSNNSNNNSNTNTNNDVEENETETQEREYDEQYYLDYQNKMINATRNYVIYGSVSIPNEGLKVDLATLIDKNYIDGLKDMVTDIPCNGYSVVTILSDSSLNIKTYLSCSNYVTEGY